MSGENNGCSFGAACGRLTTAVKRKAVDWVHGIARRIEQGVGESPDQIATKRQAVEKLRTGPLDHLTAQAAKDSEVKKEEDAAVEEERLRAQTEEAEETAARLEERAARLKKLRDRKEKADEKCAAFTASTETDDALSEPGQRAPRALHEQAARPAKSAPPAPPAADASNSAAAFGKQSAAAPTAATQPPPPTFTYQNPTDLYSGPALGASLPSYKAGTHQTVTYQNPSTMFGGQSLGAGAPLSGAAGQLVPAAGQLVPAAGPVVPAARPCGGNAASSGLVMTSASAPSAVAPAGQNSSQGHWDMTPDWFQGRIANMSDHRKSQVRKWCSVPARQHVDGAKLASRLYDVTKDASDAFKMQVYQHCTKSKSTRTRSVAQVGETRAAVSVEVNAVHTSSLATASSSLGTTSPADLAFAPPAP